MKLEVGKFYKTRDGRKARVICVDRVTGGVGWLSPVVALVLDDECELTLSYHLDGKEGSRCESSHDLVAEWTEPIKKEFVAWLGIGEVPTRDDSIYAVDRAFGTVCSALRSERREGLDYLPTVKKFKVTLEEIQDDTP